MSFMLSPEATTNKNFINYDKSLSSRSEWIKENSEKLSQKLNLISNARVMNDGKVGCCLFENDKMLQVNEGLKWADNFWLESSFFEWSKMIDGEGFWGYRGRYSKKNLVNCKNHFCLKRVYDVFPFIEIFLIR